MLSILLALVAGVVVAVGLKLTYVHSYWGVILPGLIASATVLVLMFRRAGKVLEPLMKNVERHLAGGRREMALKTLRDGLSLGRVHPMLPGQLRVQIGALEYTLGNLDAAEEELSRASRWPWLSRAYLGCVHFKRRDDKAMKKAFETAVSVGDKEGLAWTVYAFCLLARGDREAAVKVLERGVKKLPADARLSGNLELAREGKKLKVAPYGDRWASFALEGEGPVLPKAARGFAVRPGFRQKPRRK